MKKGICRKNPSEERSASFEEYPACRRIVVSIAKRSCPLKVRLIMASVASKLFLTARSSSCQPSALL